LSSNATYTSQNGGSPALETVALSASLFADSRFFSSEYSHAAIASDTADEEAVASFKTSGSSTFMSKLTRAAWRKYMPPIY